MNAERHDISHVEKPMRLGVFERSLVNEKSLRADSAFSRESPKQITEPDDG